jgi:hypothetical protein
MKKTFKLLNNLDKNAIAIYHGRKIFKEEFLSHVELTKNHLLVVPEVNKIATVCCALISKFFVFLHSFLLFC